MVQTYITHLIVLAAISYLVWRFFIMGNSKKRPAGEKVGACGPCSSCGDTAIQSTSSAEPVVPLSLGRDLVAKRVGGVRG